MGVEERRAAERRVEERRAVARQALAEAEAELDALQRERRRLGRRRKQAVSARADTSELALAFAGLEVRIHGVERMVRRRRAELAEVG